MHVGPLATNVLEVRLNSQINAPFVNKRSNLVHCIYKIIKTIQTMQNMTSLG